MTTERAINKEEFCKNSSPVAVTVITLLVITNWFQKVSPIHFQPLKEENLYIAAKSGLKYLVPKCP